MSGDERTRDEIEEIVNDEPVQEAVQESVQEAVIEPKAKAKPKIKITKQAVEPVESVEPVEPDSLVANEEPPKNICENRQMVNCPDCNILLTQHTLGCTHKKEDIAKEHPKKKLNNKLDNK